MIVRFASFASIGAALVSLSAACSSSTDSRSQNGGLGTDAGTGGSPGGGASATGGASSQNGGAANGGASGGGASAGGIAGAGGAVGGSPSTGGRAGSAGRGGAAGSTGGVQNAGGSQSTGGAATDGGPCNHCLPTYDLHWGQNGGLVAWVETSRLGPCASYSHDRTPTFTDPPSLTCNVTISACPGSPLANIIDAMGTAAFNAALTGHTLYGNDPRPVDGQVFRISIGNDFIDIGPNCESSPASCPSMPEPVARMVTLLRDLDAALLAAEPCKSVFGN